ncbi:DEAD/DEAH box helicase [Globicatella sanguinis]
MTTFKELNLQPFIQKALAELQFENLTAVQEEVLKPALAGENLIVQSQTGSGKTHSFLVPIVNQIDPQEASVQVVITAPSRELANQLYDVTRQLVKDAPEEIVVNNYVGGTDKDRQIEKLNNRQPHIVIGTPGRIFDLMSANALWVQTTKIMVVDEADMTMDLGFLSIIDEIASRMPQELQLMVFSATIPQQLSVFLNKYVTSPKQIKIEPKQVLAEEIQNYLINTKGQDRRELVYQLLTMGHPYLALVFCNTRQYADEVADYLKEQGLKVALIHGGIPPRERKRLMKQVRDLDYQFVVASDLAARGIDIPGVSMVINTEVPKELEFFVHRVGRTGRNNIAGTAYTFVTPDDDQSIVQLEKKGIEFTEVELVKGEIRPAKIRNRRQKRQDTKKDTDDAVIKGMIAKNKKRKVKPGYKKKLDIQIKEQRRQTAKKQARSMRRNQGRSGK